MEGASRRRGHVPQEGAQGEERPLGIALLLVAQLVRRLHPLDGAEVGQALEQPQEALAARAVGVGLEGEGGPQAAVGQGGPQPGLLRGEAQPLLEVLREQTLGQRAQAHELAAGADGGQERLRGRGDQEARGTWPAAPRGS